jgi:cytoskeletal protein RodZ
MPTKKSGAPAPSYAACARVLDLTRFRKKTGIPLEKIAERTKISLRFLRAIEDEEFEKLPGVIFSTSYLRQYAAVIGFDEAELLSYHDRKMNPPSAGEEEPRESENRSFLDRWLRIPAEVQR